MKTKYFGIVAFLLALFASCSSTPEFPNPRLDGKQAIDTVSRDTMDVYTIRLKMITPNGVNKLMVLDGYNYELIEDLSAQYTGQTDFELVYNVDLTEIDEDVRKTFLFKLVDNDKRTINKTFTLHIRKKSKPIITLMTESDRINIVTPIFALKADFNTGLNTIKNYKVQVVGGDVVAEKIYGDDQLVSQERLFINIDKILNLNDSYRLRVDLTDSKDQVATREVEIRRIESKLPKSLKCWEKNGTNLFEFTFIYRPGTSDISEIIEKETRPKINGVPDKWEHKQTFTYDDLDRLIGYKRVSLIKNDIPVTTADYLTGQTDQTFNYVGSTTQLREIINNRESKYSIGGIVYNSNGTVHEFLSGKSLITEISYVKDFTGDQMLLNAAWHEIYTLSVHRDNKDMIPIYIPTYQPKFPFVVAELSYNVFNYIIRELFQQKYLSLSYGKRDGTGDRYTRDFTQDEDGNLKMMVIFNAKGVIERKYEFEY